ncbi:hypothetical protein MP228_005359 [Amoeboaphelidium protococcarum]|nr:hypothetical protein MP228_005359 [Amoeboaphelidium protococcarum]
MPKHVKDPLKQPLSAGELKDPAVRKYMRSAGRVDKKAIKDVKLKAMVQKQERISKAAAVNLKQAEILQTSTGGFLEVSNPESGLDHTFKYKQKDIKQNVDYRAQQLAWDLDLRSVGWGAYDGGLSLSGNGRHVLFASRKGHISTFDQISKDLHTEFYVKSSNSATATMISGNTELVRDACWLHNEMYFALAQRDHVYIYDHTGMELHCLRNQVEVVNMDFLRYHFLLVTAGNNGVLRYHDTSIGHPVTEIKTKQGRSTCMAHNPQNAITHLGHSNGTVTLWSPNMGQQLVKMLVHRGPVNDIAIDPSGQYMATCGMDGQLKVHDLRMFRQLNQLYTPSPGKSLDISQKGMLAVSHGPRVSIFNSINQLAHSGNPESGRPLHKQMPYLTHLHEGTQISKVKFTPFQDSLVYAHTKGISSILVPGSCNPNFDALENNPYQTTRQRQEAEVKMLLEKIPSDMITLDLSHLE